MCFFYTNWCLLRLKNTKNKSYQSFQVINNNTLLAYTDILRKIVSFLAMLYMLGYTKGLILNQFLKHYI